VGIEHDALWLLGARNTVRTRCQLRIISENGPDPGQDGVMFRTHAMDLPAGLRACDPLGLTVGQGDAAIKAGGEFQRDAQGVRRRH
jgi:hypothetical protein